MCIKVNYYAEKCSPSALKGSISLLQINDRFLQSVSFAHFKYFIHCFMSRLYSINYMLVVAFLWRPHISENAFVHELRNMQLHLDF